MTAPKVAKLVPITDPLKLRDRTVHDYATTARRNGVVPDMPAIKRMAEADLGMVDRHESEKRRVPAPAPKKKAEQPRRDDDPIATHERENNVKIYTRDAPTADPIRSVLDMPAHRVNDRWSHAMARIMRILEPQGDIKQLAKGGYGNVVNNALAPVQARAFMNMFGFYLSPSHRSKWNPFKGLQQTDIHRKFVRMVENICDQSTGQLGPWYIK